MEWTTDRVELLKKLWGEGLSARQIAEALGHVTRNAVIGKAHRLGLSTRSLPSKPTIAILNPVTDRLCQWPIGNPGEAGFHREWPPLIRMDEAVKKKVDEILDAGQN